MAQRWLLQLDFIYEFFQRRICYQPNAQWNEATGSNCVCVFLRGQKQLRYWPKLPDIRKTKVEQWTRNLICFSTNLKLITANGIIVLLEQRLRENDRAEINEVRARVCVCAYKWNYTHFIGIWTTKTAIAFTVGIRLSINIEIKKQIWNTSAEVAIENHIRWLLERGIWKNFCMYNTTISRAS